MIIIKQQGNFDKIEKFLKRMVVADYIKILNKYGQEGVNALIAATPIDSGLTSSSWGYKIVRAKGLFRIVWTNSNVVDGVPIAILIQYGHGTRTGGYVQGRDYINPTTRPIFDKIATEVWREVTAL